MQRFLTFLLDARTLGIIGVAALLGFLFFGATAFELAMVYVGLALVFLLICGLLYWGSTFWRTRKASRALEQAIDEKNSATERKAPEKERVDVAALRTRMQEAVKLIKGSKLGITSGSSALYELPWYMIIGNPAAGKSTAIVKSGLKFPFADQSANVIQGIGGTRNCDWFFTTEGILLDTAGRYSVYQEDREEWMSFLGLLKKHRPKAPINGIIIAASLAELSQSNPQACIDLAKSLRQRVQELTETLEVFAPVYVMFTKADLIEGFSEFFSEYGDNEAEKVWGATNAYDPTKPMDAAGEFDRHFELLRAGLKEELLANMALRRGRTLPPGMLSFPLEFAALKPILQSFIATLFEENPYQFRPIFRGFYFSSSVHEGEAGKRASASVVERFGLTAVPINVDVTPVKHGYFLKDLFSKVIFADKSLVKQYASKRKQHVKLGIVVASIVGLAVCFAGWGAAYVANRQLMSDVNADLAKVVRVQKEKNDLGSRLEAMEILQGRIEQLSRWKKDRPLSVGLGLYQGDVIEEKLRREYFSGVQQLLIKPVGNAIEDYLSVVNKDPDRLTPMTRPPTSAAQPGESKDAGKNKANNVEEAYNALKTYLMLGDKTRAEQGHLTDQITRFWRVFLEANRGDMPYSKMAESAEKVLSFSMANLNDPAFPTLDTNFGVVDTSRENLRRVVKGMPARERVYSEIKARAATRFPAVTVASFVDEKELITVAGSYAVSGTFTVQAWKDYIQDAIKKAAYEELQSVDWVLKTSARDDLSLEGSPDQVKKILTDLYKTEYVQEWQKFMKGVAVNEFANFEDAVKRMDKLGDPGRSPIKALLTVLFDQTSWDNPSILNERLGKTQQGFMAWFKQSILRQAPAQVDVKIDLTAKNAEIPMGPIGKEFAALQRIMMSRDNSPTLITGYLAALNKLRSKLNQIKGQGDPGPAVKKLMAQTLEGAGSELEEAVRFVDEQMLVNMSDSAKATLRPLLVRPMVQSFAVMIKPVETEVNRIWVAQVYEPFTRTLADRYPFNSSSRVEANAADIAKILGPEGAVSKFSVEALGPLVVRRGDSIVAKSWGDVGIQLVPEFSDGFGRWVASLDGAGGSGGGASSSGGASAGSGASDAAAAKKTVFQVLPLGSTSFVEYTLEIDGQQLRYRNASAAWTNFFWPGTVQGVKLSGITSDGRTVDLVNEPGNYGLDRLFEKASKKTMPDGSTELTWTKDGTKVAVQIRIISSPSSATAPPAAGSGGNTDNKGGASQAPTRSGLQGLKLPPVVARSNLPVATK
jgi:type VI secretion system protein ImpL